LNYQKIMIGALGTIAEGTVFKRATVYDYLVLIGYAERTATNAVTPSRIGGMFNALIADGAIEPHGPRGYRIVDMSKIARRDKPKRIVYYTGEPKAGWDDLGLMSDPDRHEVEWHLCGKEYAPGAFNLKLFAAGRVPRKANFWMRWAHGKLSGADAGILLAMHPDIHDNIVSDMREITEARA